MNLKKEDILKLIKKGENEQVEFKTNFNDSVIETLAAFANTKGGRVLVGVNDMGKPAIKFSIGEERIQQWLNEIKNKTQPSIIPEAEVVDIKANKTICFSISEFPIKPVSFKGRYYKRVKNSNHQLTPTEITDLFMQSLQLSWDSYPWKGARYNDLDEYKITQFINKVNDGGRFSLSENPYDSLLKLRMIGDDFVSNAI
ncbi:MAG: RNA-binding domain-containing protein [Bacteroidota bacterium]